jgi:hypothetical protein
MIYDKLGKVALRFASAYLRRRYRRGIRIGAGVAAVALGAAIYLANRDAPEG